MNSKLASKYSRVMAALMSRKDQVQMKINSEMKRPNPCSITLARLKKVKLWTKDRIAFLQNNRVGNSSAMAS